MDISTKKTGSRKDKEKNSEKEVDCELSNSVKAGDLHIYDPSDEVCRLYCDKLIDQLLTFLDMEKVFSHSNKSQVELHFAKE